MLKVVVRAIEDATEWGTYKKSDVVVPVKKAPAKKVVKKRK